MAAARRASLTAALRRFELLAVADYFSPSSRVLEVGGGDGWQASIIASWGCEVRSIDIEPHLHVHHPVERYDGRTIPSEAGAFDIVFSSHVLEHVAELPALSMEMARVLRPDGVMIHLMPSATWRLWTLLAHYPYVLKRLGEALWRPVRWRVGRGWSPQPARE